MSSFHSSICEEREIKRRKIRIKGEGKGRREKNEEKKIKEKRRRRRRKKRRREGNGREGRETSDQKREEKKERREYLMFLGFKRIIPNFAQPCVGSSSLSPEALSNVSTTLFHLPIIK